MINERPKTIYEANDQTVLDLRPEQEEHKILK
jgi:hypothetical protein